MQLKIILVLFVCATLTSSAPNRAINLKVVFPSTVPYKTSIRYNTNNKFMDESWSSSNETDENSHGDELKEGWICLNRTVTEEDTDWDYEETCHHVTLNNCYNISNAELEYREVEVCEDNFLKSCSTDYQYVMFKSGLVETCVQEVKRECNAPNTKMACSIENETVCETINIGRKLPRVCQKLEVPLCEREHEDDIDLCPVLFKEVCIEPRIQAPAIQPKKKCHVRTKEVCGPETCPLKMGEWECSEEITDVIFEVPEEHCDMLPPKTCKVELQLVPKLYPQKLCLGVPKEVCTTAKVNPRKVMRQVTKRWCGPIDDLEKYEVNSEE